MLQYLICRDPFHVLLDHAKDWYEKPKIHFHPQFAQRLQNKRVSSALTRRYTRTCIM